MWRGEIDLALPATGCCCGTATSGSARKQARRLGMPRIEDAGDLAAAMGARLGAAARGLITPAEVESLARACKASARRPERLPLTRRVALPRGFA